MSTSAFNRSWARWREAVRYGFPVSIVKTCTFVERDGARYGAGIL